MRSAREHLEECAACERLWREVADRAERVGALLAELDRVPPARSVPRRRSRVPALAGLAAAALLAVLMIPRQGQHIPAPPAQRESASEHPMDQAAAAAVETPGAPMRPRTAVTRRTRQRAEKPRVDYYVALDSEPIDSGLVVRVALEDGLLADVIVDEQGRARAVRRLN
jgi:hypothetical protein